MGLSFGALAVVVRSSSGGQSAPAKIHSIADISLLDRAFALVELRSLLLGFVFVVVSLVLGLYTLLQP